MTITNVGNQNVFTNLAKGVKVICCDFENVTIEDCSNMTVSKLYGKVGNANCKFFIISE